MAEEVVSQEWYSRLEKCKTVEDLDYLKAKHAHEIHNNPDLNRLFTLYTMWLKRKLRKRITPK